MLMRNLLFEHGPPLLITTGGGGGAGTQSPGPWEECDITMRSQDLCHKAFDGAFLVIIKVAFRERGYSPRLMDQLIIMFGQKNNYHVLIATLQKTLV